MEILIVILLIDRIFLHIKINSIKEKLSEYEKPHHDHQKTTSVENSCDVPMDVSSHSTEKHELSFFAKALIWIKIEWPIKLGALLVLLGFIWLTSYAFMNNWIGPVGRIAIGIISGMIILFIGDWKIKKSVPQGSILIVLGGATILSTIFAARTLYDFFTPASALVFMALIVVFMAFYSIKYKSKTLCVLSLIAGGIAPSLTNSHEFNFASLHAYLLVLCAGTLWITNYTGWRMLAPIALSIVALYDLSYINLVYYGEDNLMQLGFAFSFAILFYATNITSIIRNQLASKSDFITAIANGLFLLLWINEVVTDEYKSLVTAATMLVFFSGAFLLYRFTHLKHTVYVYSGVAFILLVAATYFETTGSLFTLAYTLEASALIGVSIALFKDPKLSSRLCALLIPAFMMGAQSLASYSWSTGILHNDFFVLLCIAIISISIGTYLRSHKINIFIPLLVVGGFFMAALVWLTSDTLINNESISTSISLGIYTITGIVLHIYGAAKENRAIKNAGIVIICTIVLPVLLLFVMNLPMGGKIVAFFTVGLLLLGTTFISKKL